ncbi:MAG TPA: histidinol-phosphate transaminase [Casimicrobiaceae bacterium]|nr:histidinol-phosphate transaminase [Casimicrobiaceae bacterium]
MSNPHFRDGPRARLYEAELSPAIAAARFGLDPATIDDFSLNVNPCGPPASAVVAARAALDRCNAYPDTRLPALRKALARRHGVDDDRLLFGAGLDDVIKLVVHAWTVEAGRLLVHLPTFPRYELEARLRGCEVVAVRSNPPWTIDIAAIRSALAEQSAAVAFLCTPNNPTGATIATEDIAALARRFRDTIFVVDEALGDPRNAGATALARTEPNVVVLRTFSKAFGLAGLRIGYAIGPAALLALVERGRPPFNVAMPAEAAAVAVLDDDAFLAQSYETFRAEASRFAAALETMPRLALRGRHANMLLIEDLSGNAATCVDALAAQGVLVADAACFGGFEGRSAIRVSLGDPTANTRLLDAMKHLP